MKRNDKFLFRGCSKSLRRELHQLGKRRERGTGYEMKGMVPKPAVVTRTDGVTVKYEGP